MITNARITSKRRTPASIDTHVIAIQGDGQRRTGRRRSRVRVTREQVAANRPDLLARPRNASELERLA